MAATLTILKHALVLTMDSAGNIYPDGAVALRGAKIEAVGPTADILKRYEGQSRDEIDAAGGLIMPGLIDGHSHPTNQLLNPSRGTLPTIEYLSTIGYPLEAAFPAHLAKIGAKLCFAEMIRNGVTCFNDGGGEQPQAIAEAAKEIGIRGTVTRSTRDYIPASWPQGKAKVDDVPTAVAETESFIEEWNGADDGRIRFWGQLRNPYTTSDAMARAIGDVARRRNVGIHAHLASNFGDRELSRSLFGKGVVERYDDLGVLGPNFYAAHMCELDDAEVETIVSRGVSIAHAPVTYVKLGMGLGTKIPELVQKGVDFSVGTDGLVPAGSADMFRVMFSFATAYCEIRRDKNVIGPYAALRAGTIGGAKANRWESEIGSLEAGKRADLIIVDRTGPEFGYFNRDLTQTIVFACNGDKVRSVWVNGKQLMKDREMLTVDIDPLVAEAHTGMTDLFKQLDIPMGQSYPR